MSENINTRSTREPNRRKKIYFFLTVLISKLKRAKAVLYLKLDWYSSNFSNNISMLNNANTKQKKSRRQDRSLSQFM